MTNLKEPSPTASPKNSKTSRLSIVITKFSLLPIKPMSIKIGQNFLIALKLHKMKGGHLHVRRLKGMNNIL
jgi:hypothetical protein